MKELCVFCCLLVRTNRIQKPFALYNLQNALPIWFFVYASLLPSPQGPRPLQLAFGMCTNLWCLHDAVNFLGLIAHSEITDILVESGLFGNQIESWKVSEAKYANRKPTALGLEAEARCRDLYMIKPSSSHRLGIVCGTTHD